MYLNPFADPVAPEDRYAAMVACHCGDPAAAEAGLEPLRQSGPPPATCGVAPDTAATAVARTCGTPGAGMLLASYPC